jgi:phosphatidylglycerol:prolipoprotein diacylglycerol transferase
MVTVIRRHGFNAEAQGYVPLLLIVAAVITFLMPVLVEGGGLPIRGYGVMFLLAVVLAVGLAVYRAPKLGLDPEMILSLAFWMIAAGLLGARLFHVIEYWNISYRQMNPDGTFNLLGTLKTVANVPKGGLVVYGSFFGGFAVFFWFVHKHKMPALAVADLIAPSGMLGLALGRIGCLLNGCCFGGLCDLPWAIEFPQTSSASGFTPPYERQIEHGWAFGLHIGVDAEDRLVVRYVQPDSSAAQQGIKTGDLVDSIDGKHVKQRLSPQGKLVTATERLRELFRSKTSPLLIQLAGDPVPKRLAFAPPPRSPPLQPTQIYSAINAVILMLFLLACCPFRRRDGEIFALWITIYPVTRYILEDIRIDEAEMFGTSWSISQIVSIILLVAVVGIWAIVLRQPRGKLWATTAHQNKPKTR